jgi:hypothetical protein
LSWVDFSFQKHIAAVESKKFSSRLSNPGEVYDAGCDDSRFLHGLRVRQGAGKQFAAVIKRIFIAGAYQSQLDFGKSDFAPGFAPATVGLDSAPEALTP